VLKLVVVLVGLTLALLAFSPALLRPLFPAAACLVGYRIYKRNESYFLSFALWMFILSPLLRRVVDWRTSYQTQSMVLLAPLLVALLPAIHLRRRLYMVVPVIRNAALLTLAGIVFGAGIGVIKHPGSSVVLSTAQWTAPIVLCIFAASIRDREALSRAFTGTLLWGVLLMSIYGMYQFVVAPPWDTYWLNQVTLDSLSPSYGHPVPFGIRVWSTMNSPGPFSLLLSAALIWLSVLDGLFPTVVNVAGYIALSLSLVRSAWLMTILGILIAVFGCRKANPLKSAASALLAIGVVAFVLFHSTQFAQVSDRLETFSSLGSDGSVGERKDMYRYMRGLILSTPLGVGLESTTYVHGYIIDSSFVDLFYVLGWFGGVFYLAGFAYVLVQVTCRLRSDSKEQAAAIAVVLACSTQALSGDVIYRQGGIVLWLFIGVWGALSLRHAVQPDRSRAALAGQ